MKSTFVLCRCEVRVTRSATTFVVPVVVRRAQKRDDMRDDEVNETTQQRVS
jgi:hypothetical protein